MTAQWVETRTVPLSHLTRFPGNARRGDVNAIQESLRRHGQYRALVVRDVDGSLVVLAGNHTRDAMIANDDKTARCEILRCTDDEARRINLADNRLAELGGYDDAELAELLQGLDGDYEGTGWAQEDLDSLVSAVKVGGGDVDPLTEFPEYGQDISTEHTCPKCGYEWSGKA
jgi:ParB-like chromosome segregation protein Spo0J